MTSLRLGLNFVGSDSAFCIAQVQQSFADCALDVKALYTQTDQRGQLIWSASSLNSITSILLAAERTTQAW